MRLGFTDLLFDIMLMQQMSTITLNIFDLIQNILKTVFPSILEDIKPNYFSYGELGLT